MYVSKQSSLTIWCSGLNRTPPNAYMGVIVPSVSEYNSAGMGKIRVTAVWETQSLLLHFYLLIIVLFTIICLIIIIWYPYLWFIF